MVDNLIIRPELPTDYRAIEQVIIEAFAGDPLSDQSEHRLVERIRRSEAYLPELTLIAELNDRIVGHILLSEARIVADTDEHLTLALAPVSVLPEFQRQGIGSKLIHAAHEAAGIKGYETVVLLGHEGYYPRFGYLEASPLGVEFPFEGVPSANCMIKALKPGAIDKLSGKVHYSPAFGQ